MKLHELKKAIDRVKELPTLPMIANRVQKLLYDPKTNTVDLAAVIEQDQSIATKILKLVNSAFYSLPELVTNISQAIMLLGYKNISHIVMTLSVFDALRKKNKGVFDRREFWIHSIATAIIAKKICIYEGYGNPDDLFTMGLLHDIGKVFMDGFLKDEFKMIIQAAEQQKTSFYGVEMELFDVNHAMIGEWIARSWGLPLNVIAGIKHHHQEVEERSGFSISKDISIDIVRLADYAVRNAGHGNNGDGGGFKPVLEDYLFKRLSITSDDLAKAVEELPTDLKTSEILLNMAV